MPEGPHQSDSCHSVPRKLAISYTVAVEMFVSGVTCRYVSCVTSNMYCRHDISVKIANSER